MAYPVIKIDSTDGGASDSSSGAGPATEVTGTAHNNNTSSTTLTLVSGSTTDVVTDGSHAVYVNTASGRKFARITGKTASTLTVHSAFPAIDSGSAVAYSVGGVRATLAGTDSRLLMEQAASAVGDAEAGWELELQDGHTETISSTVNVRVADDIAIEEGNLRITTASGVSTRPIITFSNNGDGFLIQDNSPYLFAGFDVRNSNATKTASNAFARATNGVSFEPTIVRGVRIGTSSQNFFNGISNKTNGGTWFVVDSEIAHCAEDGFTSGNAATTTNLMMLNCHVHSNTGNGVWVRQGNSIRTSLFYRSIFEGNGEDGVYVQGGADSTAYGLGWHFVNCVFEANTGDGFDEQNQRGGCGCTWTNCIFSGNGGYGIKFSAATTTVQEAVTCGHTTTACNFHDNTSGATSLANWIGSYASHNDQTVNPTYTDASNGDYSVGAASLQDAAHPAGNITASTTPAYGDIGAGQPQSGGGGGYTPTYRKRSNVQLRM